MSMTREATKYHDEYAAAPERIKWAVDAAYDEARKIFKAAGLPTSNGDAAETLVADLFKYIIAAKMEQAGEVSKPKYELCETILPSGERCVRPKNHHEWSKAKCSPTVKFMEYSADTQCEEARRRTIENKEKRKMYELAEQRAATQ